MAKVILLVVLILKVSSSFGMEMVLSGLHNHETIEANCSDQPCGDREDCCKGSSCDCMCCGHVYIDEETVKIEIEEKLVNRRATFAYENQLSHSLAHSVWHPPCLK